MFTKRDRNEIRKIRHERLLKKIEPHPEYAASDRLSQPEQHLRSAHR